MTSFSTRRSLRVVRDREAQHGVCRVEDVRRHATNRQPRRCLVMSTLRLELKSATHLFADNLHTRVTTAMVKETARSLTVGTVDVVGHRRRRPVVERQRPARWTQGNG